MAVEQAQLMKIVESKVGINLYLDDLVTYFPGATRKHVQQAIWRIISNETLPGLVKVAENVWRYNPNLVAKGMVSAGKLFEQIAVTKSGAVLIQDEEGNLYRAEEIS